MWAAGGGEGEASNWLVRRILYLFLDNNNKRKFDSEEVAVSLVKRGEV